MGHSNNSIGRLPNLIVIGAQKSGTTSLHFYLSCHPQISMSKKKELAFFVQERNWDKGFEWYRAQFSDKGQLYCGEASPQYTYYPFFANVPKRMHRLVPEAKLIYLVRDPIQRLLSQYIHNYAAGTEDRSVTDILGQFENNPYIARSQYYLQLKQYLDYYLDSQILVVSHEELLKQRLPTLKKIFRFLGVDESFVSLGFFHTRHLTRNKRRKNRLGMYLASLPLLKTIKQLPGSLAWHIERWLYWPFSNKVDQPVLPPDDLERLKDYLRPDTDSLRRHLGLPLGDWQI